MCKLKSRFNGKETDSYEMLEKVAYIGVNPESVKILSDCMNECDSVYTDVRFLKDVDRLGLWGDRMMHMCRARGLKKPKEIVSIIKQLIQVNTMVKKPYFTQGTIIDCRSEAAFERFFDRVPI